MTDPLAPYLADLHWSNHTLARLLGCEETLIRRMRAGRRPVPCSVQQWLARLADVHRLNPPPEGWMVEE